MSTSHPASALFTTTTTTRSQQQGAIPSHSSAASRPLGSTPASQFFFSAASPWQSPTTTKAPSVSDMVPGGLVLDATRGTPPRGGGVGGRGAAPNAAGRRHPTTTARGGGAVRSHHPASSSRSSTHNKTRGRPGSTNAHHSSSHGTQQQQHPRTVEQRTTTNHHKPSSHTNHNPRRTTTSASMATAAKTPYVTPQQAQPPLQPHDPAFYGMAPTSLDGGALDNHHLPNSIHPVTPSPTSWTAGIAARQAPLAGYLEKWGSQVPAYKRRFFILQPSTNLYYFVSSQDIQPRGCLDLQDSWMEIEDAQGQRHALRSTPETMPATTTTTTRDVMWWPDSSASANTTPTPVTTDFSEWPITSPRFAICWPGGRRVWLQAKSVEQAQQWVQALQQERMEVVQEAWRKEKRQTSAYKSRIAELEATLADYKLMEKDRDGALEDAAYWQREFVTLDRALAKLARRIVGGPATSTSKTDNAPAEPTESETPPSSGAASEEAGSGEEKKEDHPTSDDSNGVEAMTVDENHQEEDAPENDTTDPTTNKSALSAPVDLNQSSSTESSLPIDNTTGELDLTEIPGSHFHTLFNACEQVRENLRLASHEASTAVKDLRDAHTRQRELEERIEKAEKHLCRLWEENCSVRKTLKQKKREKRILVQEVKKLQEQVRQQKQHQQQFHQQQNHVVHYKQPLHVPPTAARSGESDEEEKLLRDLEDHVATSIHLHEQILRPKSTRNPFAPTTPLTAPPDDASTQATVSLTDTVASREPQGPAKSLFDGEDESDDGHEDDDDNDAEEEVLPGNPPSSESLALNESIDSTPERPNPIIQLDESCHPAGAVPPETLEPTVPSVVTHTGNATTDLACPLADVVNSSSTSNNNNNADLQVYHLTFYSGKIGLQFQKVPPPPARTRGLLTEAMTADLEAAPPADRTTTELRRIAAMSRNFKSDADATHQSTLEVATPVDAVLVCGFHGFDDSGVKERPKLGARLVAFDGISVEVGRWTFESIRKAIQLRGRPLTLSFRDDFLTTEQRRILTKAVRDMEPTIVPPPPPPRHYTTPFRMNDGASSWSNHSIGSPDPDPTDDFSIRSVHWNEEDGSVPSRNSAVSLARYKFKSFSEAGSSTTSSVLSAVGPLMANLLPQKSPYIPFTPDYMRRPPVSVEDTPQHQDFKSSLL